MSEKGLSGLAVVSFESRHAKTLGDLIGLQGGNAVSAPALQEIALENNPAVFSFAEAWFGGKIDLLILLTGVGTRALVETLKTRYPEEKIMSQLRQTRLIPRGPKPVRVLNEWKVPIAVTVPEPNTWRELLATLDEYVAQNKEIDSLRGRVVAVQEYGVPNLELISGLEERGAIVQCVPVYRWALPDDLAPLEAAIQQILDGKIDVALFTTAVQAEHLLKVAASRAARLKESFKKMVIASVGPDTSAGLRQQGLEPDLEPESPKMGPLVVLTAQKAKEVLKGKR